ncbi:LysR family transcriptional regulator [Azospirillum canadense]|uniref:LysR family transcriptional regulator n=1 Tax=Azospirillum canadense TaxID=403962 RepID=UPI0022274B84|nr:LysR family transcriptional regulator [Azospirillum canadense]MCW2239824.1 DNA-binding transcriptional LysR family regulator [Azospirillum canadense]
MDLHQLRCFIAVAEELHFGRAAQKLGMLPSALGRRVRLLEEDLGTRLMTRTTRSVALTDDGACLLDEARALLSQADSLAARFRSRGRTHAATLRVGAIDSAAAGLLPMLLHDFRQQHPQVTVQIVEDKTIRLLPRLLSGRLDFVFVRPPESPNKSLEVLFLFHETVVVAVPARHPLAGRERVRIEDLADEPLIVPERRSRPHSHDLTIKLFAEAGLQARIAQLAEEKQTIINLVGAGLGVALVPRWTSRMATSSLRFIPLELERTGESDRLPLAAAWVRSTRDGVRDQMLTTLRGRLSSYAEQA